MGSVEPPLNPPLSTKAYGQWFVASTRRGYTLHTKCLPHALVYILFKLTLKTNPSEYYF